MKILVLGNGFDLEHNLQTKYTDFLLFCECFLNRDSNRADDDSTRKINQFHQVIQKLSSDNTNIMQQNLENNYWIELILERKNDIGDKWVDFEAEIFRKIREIDSIWINFQTDDIDSTLINLSKDGFMDEYTRLLDVFGPYKAYNSIKFSSIRSIRDVLLGDLNRLISAFELYLEIIVNSNIITIYNGDILSVFPNKVISFNYTETYEKVYSKIHRNPECYHIHGKIGSDNIVLGIDEYLSEEERIRDTVFLDFQKYFQRINNHTGNAHLKWLEEIEKSIGISEVYFFGHSFGKSDGDIIKSFITHKKIKTTVFYYDEKTYRDLIIQLNVILGTDTMLKLVSGSEPKMVFKRQSGSVKMTNGDYQIRKDIAELSELGKLTYMEYECLISHMIRHIKDCDKKYFHSKELLLEFAKLLFELDVLDDTYLEKLKKISSELPKLVCSIKKENYLSYNGNDLTSDSYALSSLVDYMTLDDNSSSHTPDSDELNNYILLATSDKMTDDRYKEIITGILDLYRSSGESFEKYREVMYVITEKHFLYAKICLEEMVNEKTKGYERGLLKALLKHCESLEMRNRSYKYIKTP